jgi:chromosome segregation ATPase
VSIAQAQRDEWKRIAAAYMSAELLAADDFNRMPMMAVDLLSEVERLEMEARCAKIQVADRGASFEAANARITYLEQRQAEHLALIARISQETPLVDEVAGWQAQRSAMIAELGTMRARVLEIEQACDAHAATADEASARSSGYRSVIVTIESERSRDAQAFASPGDRIANLEHELADLRESETTQATRICQLLVELHIATAEVASLRERLDSWVLAAGRAAP